MKSENQKETLSGNRKFKFCFRNGWYFPKHFFFFPPNINTVCLVWVVFCSVLRLEQVFQHVPHLLSGLFLWKKILLWTLLVASLKFKIVSTGKVNYKEATILTSGLIIFFLFVCLGQGHNSQSKYRNSSSSRPQFSETRSRRYQPYEGSRSRSEDDERFQARQEKRAARDTEKSKSGKSKRSRERKQSRKSKRSERDESHGLIFNDVQKVTNPNPTYWALGLLELPVRDWIF